ncbi:unnamed protein product [Arabidopsis lyrata]|nr:unnamed protein product [Arabidopsis lyrata]
MVAATDCPNKFKSIGDKFAQLLFSCRVGRCIGCDHLELSVPGDDEANRGRGTTGDGGGGTAVDEDYEVGGSKESKANNIGEEIRFYVCLVSTVPLKFIWEDKTRQRDHYYNGFTSNQRSIK